MVYVDEAPEDLLCRDCTDRSWLPHEAVALFGLIVCVGLGMFAMKIRADVRVARALEKIAIIAERK